MDYVYFVYLLPQPLIICNSVQRPLVILGLLAGYNATSIRVGLGRDILILCLVLKILLKPMIWLLGLDLFAYNQASLSSLTTNSSSALSWTKCFRCANSPSAVTLANLLGFLSTLSGATP